MTEMQAEARTDGLCPLQRESRRGNLWLITMSNQPTVAGMFRRALEIREKDPSGSLKDVKKQLVSEFSGMQFPSTEFLTIPEYDNVTPEEDWTAGLPVILRGIQHEDWNEIAHGLVISLEQVENYPKQSGREDDPSKDWRNRTRTIADAEEKVLQKWMPEDLMDLAKGSVRRG
jgi:hypothetical protein